MQSVEDKLGIESDADEFRHNLISVVAGHAIDRPGERVDYLRIFPRHIERLREAYYGEHRKQVGAIARDMLVVLDDGAKLEPERTKVAETTIEQMESRYGYQRESLREALGELIEERYSS
jgi:hypothetical protein